MTNTTINRTIQILNGIQVDKNLAKRRGNNIAHGALAGRIPPLICLTATAAAAAAAIAIAPAIPALFMEAMATRDASSNGVGRQGLETNDACIIVVVVVIAIVVVAIVDAPATYTVHYRVESVWSIKWSTIISYISYRMRFGP